MFGLHLLIVLYCKGLYKIQRVNECPSIRVASGSVWRENGIACIFHLSWASCQIWKLVGCTCTGNAWNVLRLPDTHHGTALGHLQSVWPKSGYDMNMIGICMIKYDERWHPLKPWERVGQSSDEKICDKKLHVFVYIYIWHSKANFYEIWMRTSLLTATNLHLNR